LKEGGKGKKEGTRKKKDGKRALAWKKKRGPERTLTGQPGGSRAGKGGSWEKALPSKRKGKKAAWKLRKDAESSKSRRGDFISGGKIT